MGFSTILLALGAVFTIVGTVLASQESSKMQAEFANQLTGGGNKPVISVGGSSGTVHTDATGVGLDELRAAGFDDMADIAAKEREEDAELPTVRGLHAPLRVKYKTSFIVINDGEFPLKDVVVTVKDPFRPSTPTRDINHVPYNLKTKSFDSRDDGKYHAIRIGNLPPKTRKKFYITGFIADSGEYKYEYELAVEWSGGYYYMVMAFQGIGAKTCDYYTEDGQVDPAVYFKRQVLLPSSNNLGHSLPVETGSGPSTHAAVSDASQAAAAPDASTPDSERLDTGERATDAEK